MKMDIAGGDQLGASVKINAYDDNALVGSVVLNSDGRVTVDFSGHQIVQGSGTGNFDGRFTSVDKIEFIPLAIHNFSVDDITLVAVGDTIDVPVGTDIAALLASAESDGKSGTILTHASGKLDLLGVDPNTALAAWFHVGQG